MPSSTSKVHLDTGTARGLIEKENPLGVLIRQVDSHINKERSGTNQIGPSVSYSKLYCLSSGSDKALMIIGWLAAAIAGLGMPSFVFLIGDIIDSFDPSRNSAEDMLNTISLMSLIFTIIGFGIWFFCYLNYSLLLMFSERIAKKTRIAYL